MATIRFRPQAADAHGLSAVLRLHQVEPEAEALVAGQGARPNVLARILYRAHTPVSDVLQE